MVPQKRALDDDHSPAVPSPLNPENKAAPKVQIQAPEETQQAAVLNREKRTKKDSFKKREAKAAAGGSDSSRATPDPKPKHKEPSINELLPARYKLAPPKLTDFELARGPVFNSHHEVQGPEGETIEFFDATEQYAFLTPSFALSMKREHTLTILPLQCLQQESLPLHPLHSGSDFSLDVLLSADRDRAVRRPHGLRGLCLPRIL